MMGKMIMNLYEFFGNQYTIYSSDHLIEQFKINLLHLNNEEMCFLLNHLISLKSQNGKVD